MPEFAPHTPEDPQLHFVHETEEHGEQPLVPLAGDVERMQDFFAAERQRLEAIPDATEGLDMDRVHRFLNKIGVGVGSHKVFDPADRPLAQPYYSAEWAEHEIGGIYLSAIDMVLVERNPLQEATSGPIFTEATLVHEEVHRGGRQRHSVMKYPEHPSPESSLDQVGGRQGFSTYNLRTQEVRGDFFEEGHVEMAAGDYRVEATGSPNGLLGGDERADQTLTRKSGEQLPLRGKYLFRAQDGGIGFTTAGFAANGMEMLIEHSPELRDIMAEARTGDGHSLRKFREAVDGISPGLYGVLRKLPYTDNAFIEGMAEIKRRLDDIKKQQEVPVDNA